MNMDRSITTSSEGLNRRDLIRTGLLLAGGAVLPACKAPSKSSAAVGDTEMGQATMVRGRRKLGGRLEVSSVGLGVQNMSRKYETTIPSRPEMHRIIRTA